MLLIFFIPSVFLCFFLSFFFNDTATTEIYTLSLHDALPTCAISSAARALGSDAKLGATVLSFAACRWMASTTLGWLWPMLTWTNWEAKSSHRLPWPSQKWQPSACVTNSGSRARCADHE